MLKDIKSVLFATNLLEDCLSAFESAVRIASKYHAVLFLLHVRDQKLPTRLEEQLRDGMGEDRWQRLMAEHDQEVRETLIGKMTQDKIAQKAMRMYYTEAGLEENNTRLRYSELVVKGHSIPDTIIDQAIEQDCDLIVLGSQKGFRKKNAVGSVTKGVLHQTAVPVLVVPSRQKQTGS